MRKGRLKICVGCLVLLLLFPVASMGAGFALLENGAKPLAMGNAFAAQADDPSALFFNPAGITQLEGKHLSVGTTIISSEFKYETSEPAPSRNETSDGTFFPSTVYYTQQLSDQVWWGLGFFSPFGLETDWNKDWTGRYISTKSTITTFELNPNLAMKVGERGSFALGLRVLYVDAELNKQLPYSAAAPSPTSDATQKLTGDGWGVGANAAYHWKGEKWRFGISGRTPISVSVKGEVDFSFQPGSDTTFTPAPVSSSQFFPDGGVRTNIELPGMVTGGIAYTFFDKLTAEFDLQWTDWSSIDKLVVSFDNPLGFGAVPTSTEEFAWDSVWAYRFGVQYQATDALALRAGYTYDQSPIPDKTFGTRLPGNDRQLFSFGGGYKVKNFTIDLTYVYWDLKERTKTATSSQTGVGVATVQNPSATIDAPAAGDYSGEAHFVGIQLSYAF